MACRELIKITGIDNIESVQSLLEFLTRLDSRQWKNLKNDDAKLMKVISKSVYLPEEGKALTQDDIIHLKAVQQQINLLANKFENIKGDDLNKLLKIFEPSTTSQDESISQEQNIDTSTQQILDTIKAQQEELVVTNKELLNIAYVNNKGYDRLRKFDLTRNTIKSIFISPNKYELNSNEWAINSNIVNLKNQWMNTISLYLGGEKADMYTKVGNSWKYNHKVDDIIEAFKHKIYKKEFKSSFSSDEKYRNAIAAFFNLINFDDDIKEIIGKDLKVVGNSNHSFTIKNMPYTLKGESSLRKSWSDNELINGLTNISQMSKSLFKIIPYINSNNEDESQFIDDISAITAFSHLRQELASTNNQYLTELKQRAQTFRDNSNKLLYDIFNNPHIEDIIGTFEQREQDILHSIKQWGFSNGGLYELQLGKVTHKATILDCIVTSLISLDPMNYQQVYIVNEGNRVSSRVTIKDRFNYNRETLNTTEVINNQNDNVTTMDNSMVIHNNFGKLDYINPAGVAVPNSYQIKHGNLLIVVGPNTKKTNLQGILSTNPSNLDIYIFKISGNQRENVTNQYINGDFNEKAIINGSIDSRFVEMFDFIEDSLDLKTMSQDQLHKQYAQMQKLFGHGTYNGFTGMLVTAVRNEIVKHIVGYYNDFVENYPQAAASQLSIANFFDPNTNPLLPDTYSNINLKATRGSIARPGETGTEFRVANAYLDNWLFAFGQSKKIVEGTNVSAVTSNAQGSKIPNYRQYSIGNNIQELLREQVNSESRYKGQETRTSASSQLLFVNNLIGGTNLVMEPRLDLEAVDAYGKSKQLKNMSSAELLYHGIMDNFYAHLFDDSNPYVSIKPADYSDKTSDFIYPIRAGVNVVNIGVPLNKATRQDIQDSYKASIGQFYKRLLNNTLYDLTRAINRQRFPSFPLTTGDNTIKGWGTDGLYHIGYDMTEDQLLEASKIFDKWITSVPSNPSIQVDGHTFTTSTLLNTDPETILYQNDLGQDVTVSQVLAQAEKGLRETDLVKMAQQAGVNLYVNVNYVKNKDKIKLNPLAVYLGSQQFKPDNFINRWQMEQASFLDTLLKKGFKVKLTQTINIDPEGNYPPIIKSLPAQQLVTKFFQSDNLKSWRQYTDDEGNTKEWNLGQWVRGDYMVLGKAVNEDGKSTDLLFDSQLPRNANKIIINPILEYFFNVDNLLSGNMRYTMLGTELSDPLKYKDYDSAKGAFINNITKRINSEEDPQEQQRLQAIKSQAMSIDFKNGSIQNIEFLSENVPTLFHEQEANLWNTSNKRANIVSATMIPFMLGTQQGISRDINAATIEDIGAHVWNFRGQKDSDIDAMDGSTFINPIQAVFESWSLGGQTIGMDKKTIGHAYDNRTGSVVLWKHATYAITNERMRMSSNSEIKLTNIFKKMSSMKFDGINDINLVDGRGYKFDNLYYESGPNQYRMIWSLNYDASNNLYYTKEFDVDINGNKIDDTLHIEYQVFDATTQEKLTPEEYNNRNGKNVETINSVYELHRALGGIYSKELTLDTNTLIDSENSNIASAQILNNASYVENNEIIQPYKNKMIHYLANKSASKRAQGNVNSKALWFNNEPLTYVPMTMTHYGVQLDADHDKDAGEITQPTQAITALEQGGNLHYLSKRVYYELGQLAMETCKLELDTANKFLEAYNDGKKLTAQEVQEITENIGQLVAASYSQQSDAELGDIILQGISKVLKSNNEDLKQNFAIPFSDATLYGSLLPSIATVINNKGIKGKYKGLALVLTPGFKYVQTFKYGGETHMSSDVYNDAIAAMTDGTFNPLDYRPIINGKNKIVSLSNDQETRKSQIIDNNNLQILPLSSDYQIRKQQIIDCYLLYQQQLEEAKGNVNFEEFVPSDVVDVVYKVLNRKTKTYVNYRTHIALDNIDTYYDFIDANTNGTLKEYLLSQGALIDPNSEIVSLHQDVMHGRDLAPERVVFDYGTINPDGIFNKVGHTNIFLIDGIRNNRKNSNMRKQEYQKILNDLHNGQVTINGQTYVVQNKQLQAAENVMPNIYSKIFGVDNLSLIEAKKLLQTKIGRADYFQPKVFKGNYDVAFITGNNKHTYLSFSEPLIKNDAGVFYKEKDISNNIIAKKERELTWLYKVSRDKQLLYKVGLRTSEGDIQLVKEYDVTQQGGQGTSSKYNYYYVDINKLRALGVDDLTISNIINDIYHQKFYLGAEISDSQKNSQTEVDLISDSFRDPNLKQFINNQFSLIGVVLEDARNEYYQNKQKYLMASFEKTLDTVADRIPTASLQSFMKMRTVGFTQINNNRIYVSHFQAWLQGADYDVDKAYVMGFNFNDNGQFIGWSDLFDYSSNESLESSCSLPVPRNSKWIKTNNGINIERYAEEAQKAYDSNNIILRNALINKVLDNIDYSPNSTIEVNYSNPILNQLISDINTHESTQLSGDNKILAFQNAVSWTTQAIVNDERNLLDSYSPTNVEGMKQVVKDKQLASDSGTYTQWNPATKWVLQEENLIGKNVISVAANAEKVYFSLLHYYNEIVRHPEKYNKDLYTFAKSFEGVFMKIDGTPVIKETIGGINFNNDNRLNKLSILLLSSNQELTNIKNSLIQEIYQGNTSEYEQDFINAYKNNEYSDKLQTLLNSIDTTLSEDDAKYMPLMQSLINNATDPSDLISQLLNSATDNAKELILNKINAGMNLAGVHGYLMIMGFPLDQIVDLMTSPVVRLVDRLSKSDMFSDIGVKSNSVQKVLDQLISSNPDKQKDWFQYVLDPTTINNYDPGRDTIVGQTLVKLLNDTSITSDNGTTLYFINGIYVQNDNNPVNPQIKTYKRLKDAPKQFQKPLESLLRQRYDGLFFNKLKGFKAVHRGARETTAAAQLLFSMNQGIRTQQNEQLAFENRFNNFIKGFDEILPSVQEIEGLKTKYAGKLLPSSLNEQGTDLVTDLEALFSKVKELHPNYSNSYIYSIVSQSLKAGIYKNFSFYEYMINAPIQVQELDGTPRNTDYRTLATEYYNLIKDSINVLDVINHSDQYRVYLELQKAATVNTDIVSKKSQLVRKFYEILRRDRGYIDSKKLNQIQSYIDQAYIQQYLTNIQLAVNNEILPFSFPLKEGQKLLKDQRPIKVSSNTEIIMNSKDNIATFKYWFHKYLIPSLKTGSYWDGEKMQEFPENRFINGLQIRTEQGKPVLSLDIDMLSIDKSRESTLKYAAYEEDFNKLINYKIGQFNLQDIFMIYNLFVNGNKYGYNRLTTLFQSKLVEDINNIENPQYTPSALMQWYKHLGQADKANIQQTIDTKNLPIEDSINALGVTLKGFDIYSAPYVESLQQAGDNIVVRIKDPRNSPTKGLVVLYDTKDHKYINPFTQISEGYDNQRELIERLKINKEYYPINIDLQEQINKLEQMFKDIVSGGTNLYNMTISGKVKIRVNC